ncbi:MAG: molecular chaperone HtpG [Deltaproteobacteria bacterium]|nr:molecular chaperone HtpG [Deltaproteobacteria bacterium]
MAKHEFEAEVSQLLQLIIHSLYSKNLVDDKYKDLNFDPRIDVEFDADSRTITISDSGIGMNEKDLTEQLGTIARSGTKAFMEKISGDKNSDSNLIGQFGVGFYSAFMVADFVEVTTKKAMEDKAWRWSSNGKGDYEITESEREGHGTSIELRLNEDGRERANRFGLQAIIKKYSNHISHPIFLHYTETRSEGEGDDKKEIKEDKEEQINDGGAMWRRPKRDLSEEDYNEFFKSLSNDPEDPMLTLHSQAEGTLEYTTLFFVPKKAPPDMYYADYRSNVRLLVKRVFITDDNKELMPTWLRFVHGIIDSEDLPLNVSREILQKNPVMDRIRTASVKKLIEEFEKLAEDKEKYTEFWKEFGRPVKEGLYQDWANRERLLELVRFKSTADEGLTSLAEYKERMNEGQESIYYLAGSKEQNLRNSPLLETYKKKKIEVLLMDDEIDDIVIPSVGKYGDLTLKSVQLSDATEDIESEEEKKAAEELKPLLERVKKVLSDSVRDVRASTRLSDSPSCIVLDANDPTTQMRGFMKSMGQDMPDTKPILEINPGHSIVEKLNDTTDDLFFENVSKLLLEQAMLLEGMELTDTTGFVKRLNDVLGKAL